MSHTEYATTTTVIDFASYLDGPIRVAVASLAAASLDQPHITTDSRIVFPRSLS